MSEITIVVNTATTIYINDPDSTFGTFFFNEDGDLFLNCDWGVFCYTWRAFKGQFRDFLKGTDAEYVVKKLATNYNYDKSRNKYFGGEREKVGRIVYTGSEKTCIK